MHIMTENGWVQLVPPICREASNNDGRHRGELPSPQCEAYIAELAQEVREMVDARIARRGEEHNEREGSDVGPATELEAV